MIACHDCFTCHKNYISGKRLKKKCCVHFISNESCIVAVIASNDRNTRLPVFCTVSLPVTKTRNFCLKFCKNMARKVASNKKVILTH